jgi:NOL1/NOP2/fmu family ribosome biogenesis protein
MEKYDSDSCAAVQRSILDAAAVMLKPGGTLVYSTCTFSIQENELVVAEFLNRNREFTLMDGHVCFTEGCGISDGICAGDRAIVGAMGLKKTVRVWPHLAGGEGHFAATLVKDKVADSQCCASKTASEGERHMDIGDREIRDTFLCFEQEELKNEITGHIYNIGKNVYSLPVINGTREIFSSGLKTLKYGRYIGEMLLKERKFIPSHSLLLSLDKDQVKNAVNLEVNDMRVEKYLKGETIEAQGGDGLAAVAVGGYYLGWGKSSGGILKNLYPKGWRKMR